MKPPGRALSIILMVTALLVGGLIAYTALLWQQAVKNHTLGIAVERDDLEAARQGDLELTRLLLTYHAAVGLRDDRGKTALDLAATPQIRALLRKAGGKN